MHVHVPHDKIHHRWILRQSEQARKKKALSKKNIKKKKETKWKANARKRKRWNGGWCRGLHLLIRSEAMLRSDRSQDFMKLIRFHQHSTRSQDGDTIDHRIWILTERSESEDRTLGSIFSQEPRQALQSLPTGRRSHDITPKDQDSPFTISRGEISKMIGPCVG